VVSLEGPQLLQQHLQLPGALQTQRKGQWYGKAATITAAGVALLVSWVRDVVAAAHC
jgi:hypothetical protein